MCPEDIVFGRGLINPTLRISTPKVNAVNIDIGWEYRLGSYEFFTGDYNVKMIWESMFWTHCCFITVSIPYKRIVSITTAYRNVCIVDYSIIVF